MTASVIVLRNMPREQQLAAYRRMLATTIERRRLIEKHAADIVREINRLKRMDAAAAGHDVEPLR